jgi:hypothetical protein
MDAYIYYRVPAAHAGRFHARAAAMQARLSKRHGIVAQLKRRPAEKDGLHTWMEVYCDIPAGFDAILAQALTAADLTALIAGERHTELFMDHSCA